MKRTKPEIFINSPKIKVRKQLPSRVVVTKIIPDKRQEQEFKKKKIRVNLSPEDIDCFGDDFYN